MDRLRIEGFSGCGNKIANDVERIAAHGGFPALRVASVSASYFLFTISIKPHFLLDVYDTRFESIWKNEKPFRPIIHLAEIRGMHPTFKGAR